MAYALRDTIAAFRRAPLLVGLSATLIGLSLFLIGLFGIAAHNIRSVLDRVESRVEVVAYLRDDAQPAAVEAAMAELRGDPSIRDVRYVSREEALRRAQEELPEFQGVFAGIEDNPLPASIEIALHPNRQDAAEVRSIAERTRALPFVEDVDFGDDWLDKVYLLRRVAAASTLVLGAAFAAVAAVIIGAAIRLAIFARRDEISIMQLVGATDWYIRRPFLVEGLITGFLGGLLALLATWLVYALLSGSVFQLEWLPDMWIVAGLILGALLGVAASALAVRRYVRTV